MSTIAVSTATAEATINHATLDCRNDDSEPTIVETLEEAAFILDEEPSAEILIRPKKCALVRFCKA